MPSGDTLVLIVCFLSQTGNAISTWKQAHEYARQMALEKLKDEHEKRYAMTSRIGLHFRDNALASCT